MMRFGLELHVVTALDKSTHRRCFPECPLFVSAMTKARGKLSKLCQIEIKANDQAEQNLTKLALFLTSEVM